MTRIFCFLELVAWAAFIAWGGYTIYKRDFAGPASGPPEGLPRGPTEGGTAPAPAIMTAAQAERAAEKAEKAERARAAAQTEIEQLEPVLALVDQLRADAADTYNATAPGTKAREKAGKTVLQLSTRRLEIIKRLSAARNILKS